jgi:hypothetical protein
MFRVKFCLKFVFGLMKFKFGSDFILLKILVEILFQYIDLIDAFRCSHISQLHNAQLLESFITDRRLANSLV